MQQISREAEELLEQKENKERLACLEALDQEVNQAQRVPKATQEHQASLVTRASKDPKVSRESLAVLEMMERRVIPDRLATLG